MEMATERLSRTMKQEYGKMVAAHMRAANAGSFEAWYAGSEAAYAERVTGNRRADLRKRWAERRRPVYEDACRGIVETGAGYGTLKALERRGRIEILPSTTGSYRVRLLNWSAQA